MDKKEKTMVLTIVLNLVLIALRFYLADLSGSLGLKANAWHSVTDVFVTTVVLAGLIIARLGADKFTWIASKIENVMAILVAAFIFHMGIDIVIDALSTEAPELQHIPFVAAGALLGVVINYFMAEYKIRMGKESGSPSLIADGYHSKMDMYCSIAVLVGILGSLFGIPSLDKISALIVMVFLISAGFEILTQNIRALLCKEGETCSNHHHQHFGIGEKIKKIFK